MIAWITKNLALIAIVVVAVVLFSALSSMRSCTNAKTETKLATGQTGAAVESGKDAVDTIGNRAAADGAGDDLTRANDDDIRAAEGANAAVAAPARHAGLKALCRRAAYRETPQCR